VLEHSVDVAEDRLRRFGAGELARWLGLLLIAAGLSTYGVGGSLTAADNQAPDALRGEPPVTFRCHADFQFAAVPELLADLERLQVDLEQTLQIERSHEPIELYLFPDNADYTQFLHDRYPQVPPRRAMYIKDRGAGQVFAQLGNSFQIDLHHEATHALLHGSLAQVPLWLDEGLAKYFEVPREIRANGNPYLPIVQVGARRGEFPRLDILERMRNVADMGPREYCSAWAWVHFMLNGPPAAHAELIRYLDELRGTKAAGDLSDRLAQRLPDLDRLFLRHFAEGHEP
jgi:hypothetical protein